MLLYLLESPIMSSQVFTDESLNRNGIHNVSLRCEKGIRNDVQVINNDGNYIVQ